jgi:hypothetical protein
MRKKTITGVGIGIAAFLIVMYWGIKTVATRTAQDKVNEVIVSAEGFAHITCHKVSVDLPGMDVRISDILVSPVGAAFPFRIQELILHRMDLDSDIPAFLSVTCRKIELNVKDLGDIAAQISELGYGDTIRVNLHLDYAYSAEKKELDLKTLRIDSEDAGMVDLSLRLGNISLQPRQLALLVFTLSRVTVSDIRLIYQDTSLVDRLMKTGAKENRIPVDEYKERVIQSLEKEIDKGDDMTGNAWKAINNFLESPDAISITATPSHPRSIGQIMQMKDLKELMTALDIQVF